MLYTVRWESGGRVIYIRLGEKSAVFYTQNSVALTMNTWGTTTKTDVTGH